MNVRAKFTCTSVRKYMGTTWIDGKHTSGILYEYEFFAVSGDHGENEKFFASTPSGTIKLSSVRDDLFDPGMSYYVDFVIPHEDQGQR